MTNHEVVSEQQWIAARRALLVEEKAFMRAKDRLAEKRRALPWAVDGSSETIQYST
jgi:predicted dithiol-disulfide oxidoreductase (DUF899 family)